MSFGGPPVKTETIEQEDELVRLDENESKIGTVFFILLKDSLSGRFLTIT